MQIDTLSPTWVFIQEYLKEREAEATRRLKKPGVDPVQTEFLRGQLDALDKIRSLSDRQQ